jgi:hypothetical protein
MADLFPKPFPNANLSRAIVSPAIQKARPVYRIHFLPDSFLQLFLRCWQWNYGHHLRSDCHSFSTIPREVLLDVYNSIRPLNPLYQSLGCLIRARRCT